MKFLCCEFNLQESYSRWVFYFAALQLNKFSDEQFIQPGICAGASQIPFIAGQNLKFCPCPSA
jgi:hypothetical protein